MQRIRSFFDTNMRYLIGGYKDVRSQLLSVAQLCDLPLDLHDIIIDYMPLRGQCSIIAEGMGRPYGMSVDQFGYLWVIDFAGMLWRIAFTDGRPLLIVTQ
jgi:hypothetical protein